MDTFNGFEILGGASKKEVKQELDWAISQGWKYKGTTANDHHMVEWPYTPEEHPTLDKSKLRRYRIQTLGKSPSGSGWRTSFRGRINGVMAMFPAPEKKEKPTVSETPTPESTPSPAPTPTVTPEQPANVEQLPVTQPRKRQSPSPVTPQSPKLTLDEWAEIDKKRMQEIVDGVLDRRRRRNTQPSQTDQMLKGPYSPTSPEGWTSEMPNHNFYLGPVFKVIPNAQNPATVEDLQQAQPVEVDQGSSTTPSRQKATGEPTFRASCGTSGGIQAHRKNGETKCDYCTVAKWAQNRQDKQKRGESVVNTVSNKFKPVIERIMDENENNPRHQQGYDRAMNILNEASSQGFNVLGSYYGTYGAPNWNEYYG